MGAARVLSLIDARAARMSGGDEARALGGEQYARLMLAQVAPRPQLVVGDPDGEPGPARPALRKARLEESEAIASLNNHFAAQGLMLRRTPEMIAMAIDDYVVAVDEHGRVVACGALKEYSPSVAEIAAIAVAPDQGGRGLGKAIVGEVERLAVKRGIYDVFALTLQPDFFASCGYTRVDRARYPEKIRRDCLGCARRFACNETCFAKSLPAPEPSRG